MTCEKCGAHGQNDAFCSKCGATIEQTTTVCSSCLKEVLNSHFCHLCGESLEGRTCMQCGAADQTGKFCRSCGGSPDEKPEKKPMRPSANGACPSCGEVSMSPAPRTDKWVVCLSCLKRFDRTPMVNEHCPICGGDAVFQKRGDGGPYCAQCLQVPVSTQE
jgi:hypothetical protein